jgi:hypothetical protein
LVKDTMLKKILMVLLILYVAIIGLVFLPGIYYFIYLILKCIINGL